MRRLLITLVIFVGFAPNFLSAQDLQLNRYSFGEGIIISGNEGYSIKLGGIVQPSFESKIFTDPTHPDLYNRFRMRRLNIRLAGDALKQKVEYGLQIDLSGTGETGDASNSILMDAWVAYNLTKQIQFTFGQRSTPTDNRELTMGSQSLQLVERSRLTSAFSNIREFGLFVDGTFKTGGDSYLKPCITITNGDGLNVIQKDHGGLKFGGRLDYLPFGLFTNLGQFRQADVVRELTPKLVIGGNLSHNIGISSRNGKESGTILYLDNLSQESLPNYTKYGIDFLFKYRGFSVIGEFVGTTATVPSNITQRVRTDGSTSTIFEDIDGLQNVSNYVKERMILGKAYNIQAGYVFKNRVSVDARYTHLAADRHSFLNNGTFYNRPNYYTVGISKYLSRGYGMKIQASVTYATPKAGSNDLSGMPITGNEWTMNVITSIAF
jgi:hypothetical protein